MARVKRTPEPLVEVPLDRTPFPVEATREQAEDALVCWVASRPAEMRAAWEAQAADLEAAGSRKHRESQESFERCDTDGFLSQWASDITGRKRYAEAAVVRNGHRGVFPVILRLDGSMFAFETIQGNWGPVWFAEAPRAGESPFLSTAKREATYQAKGYRLAWAVLPARVILDDGGARGLAGCANVRVRTVPDSQAVQFVLDHLR